MTQRHRSNSVLRGMLTRRDKKIAAQAEQLLEARRIAADAVALARQVRFENAALQKHIVMLQRPGHGAKRSELARRAIDILEFMEPLAEKIQYALQDYRREQQRLSGKDRNRETK
jgi:hypothetical protein